MAVAVVIGLTSAVLTALVTEVYCHRCVAHRAFRVHPVFGSFLDLYVQVTGGIHPETWAAIHRRHHRYADTPLDPHSPRQRRPLAVLVATPYLYAKARKEVPGGSAPGTGTLHLALRVVLVGTFFAGFGLAQVLVMLVVHLIGYLGIMGLVNSVGHLHGRKPHPAFPGYDAAWLAIPLLGHGYHNSHHAHPAAARTGRLDPIWPLLVLFGALGLAELADRPRQTSASPCCTASVSPARS